MQHIDIIIDNRISCSFIESSSIENVIFCRPLEESLDNVSIISTKDNEFIHSYIQESTSNYLETDVQLPDGRVYPNVRFKLVTIENDKELPESTINLSLLGSHSSINEYTTSSNLIEESYDFTPDGETDEESSSDELHVIPVSEDVSEYVEKVKSYEAHLIEEQARIKAEAQRLNRERIVLEDDRRIQKTLEDYKSELLHETFHISEQQKQLIEQSINEAVVSIQGQFDDQQINVGKYLETLSSANLEEVKKYQDNQVNEIKSSINSLLAERLEQASVENDKLLLERATELEAIFTEKIITELEEHKRNIGSEIDTITKSLDVIVTEKITLNNDNVDVLLVNRAGILQDQFSEKVATDLAEYKNNLSREFKTSSTETASRIFNEKTAELNKAVTVLLDEHKQNLNNTITDKLNTVGHSIDKFKSEVDGKLPELNTTIKDINKRIQSLVTEKKNVQLLVDDARKYTDTKVAKVSEEVMSYARRILDLGGGGGSNAVQYANGGTMNGNLNVTGQYLSGGVSLFNILSGSGGGAGNPNVNALVISASANWNTAYNISTVYANNSASYATTSYVDSNFLNLTGGLVSGPVRINNNLTVFGNLTATGTTTFANTVFSVTSALSVIHVGSGPAMYVGNSGDGDIASFYDLDQNIEVLHVGGNNGSFPNVGVKTSAPNVDFTVNGQISANNTIWSAGGNSNNWNSAFNISTAYQNASGSFVTTPIGDTRYSKLSSQVYKFGSGTNSIQPISGNNVASGAFSVVAGGGSNSAGGTLLTNILAYWKLDNNGSGGVSLIDSTGNSNTLTNNNGVLLGTGFLGNGSANFASVNSFLSYPSFQALGTGDFSISAWIKPIFTSSYTSIATTRPSDVSSYSYITFGTFNGDIYFYSGGGFLANVSGVITEGVWQHVVLTKVSGVIKIYVNNIEVASVPDPSGNYIATQFNIGANSDGSIYFTGDIDEYSIWNRSLQPSEVTALYSSGSGLPYDSFNTITFTSPGNVASGDYSFIAGGQNNNTNNRNNTFILGSDITAPVANYTYVNNLSTSGSLVTGSLSASNVYVDGNVGIGTSTPAAKLDVNGNIYIGNQAGSYVNTIVTGPPEIDFGVGGQRKMVFGYDPGVSRGIFYSDVLGGGIFYYDSDGIAIGNNTNTYNGNILKIPYTWDQVNIDGLITATGGNSTQWNTAYNTATAYQNISGSFVTNTLLRSTSALLTPLTLTRTLTGLLVTKTDFNAVSSTFLTDAPSNGSQYARQNGAWTVVVATSGGSGGNSAYSIVDSNFNALVNQKYLVNTLSANIVGTLPSSPSLGDNITFVDLSNYWSSNPLILNNNGNLLQTYNEPLTANISGYQFQLVYIGGIYGWKII